MRESVLRAPLPAAPDANLVRPAPESSRGHAASPSGRHFAVGVDPPAVHLPGSLLRDLEAPTRRARCLLRRRGFQSQSAPAPVAATRRIRPLGQSARCEIDCSARGRRGLAEVDQYLEGFPGPSTGVTSSPNPGVTSSRPTGVTSSRSHNSRQRMDFRGRVGRPNRTAGDCNSFLRISSVGLLARYGRSRLSSHSTSVSTTSARNRFVFNSEYPAGYPSGSARNR